MRKEAINVKITKIIQETPTVKTFSLKLRDNFRFYPGQWVEIEPYNEEYGVLRRGFSISSSPLELEKGYFDITVKRVPNGFVTDFLHGHARVGDTLKVWGPFGEFYFKKGFSDRLVLIGAGSGITPLMSILRYVRDATLSVQIQLLYSARSADEIIFWKELEKIRLSSRRIKCSITITQPLENSWVGHRGRIELDFLKENISDVKSLFYVCVPHGMLSDMLSGLVAAGVQPERIKTERW